MWKIPAEHTPESSFPKGGLTWKLRRSGELNAKTRELMQLQALARERLAATQRNFADGMKAAKEVQRDLDWTQKRVS